MQNRSEATIVGGAGFGHSLNPLAPCARRLRAQIKDPPKQELNQSSISTAPNNSRRTGWFDVRRGLCGEVNAARLLPGRLVQMCLTLMLENTDPTSPVRSLKNCLVRSRRLELPRAFAHNDLNVARLPIPPRPHTAITGRWCAPVGRSAPLAAAGRGRKHFANAKCADASRVSGRLARGPADVGKHRRFGHIGNRFVDCQRLARTNRRFGRGDDPAEHFPFPLIA